MQDHEAAVKSFRRRVGVWLSVRYAVAVVTAWCFAWGVSVIVLRVTMDIDRPPLAWGAAGIAGAMVLGVVWAMRTLPDRAAIRAAVDRHNDAGGMVMAAEETDLGMWGGRIKAVGTPALRWRGGRAWGVFAAAAAFVVIAFAMPDRLVAINRAQPLDVGEQVGQLEEQLAVLEEEKIVQPDAAQQVRDKLHQVRDEARGDDPVKTWAALDRMQENMAHTATRAAEQAVRSAERLADAEALAKTLEQAGQTLDGKTMAEAMNDLAAMMDKALSAKDLPADALDAATMQKLAEAMKGMAPGDVPPLDAETLKKIAAACKACKGDRQAMIARLVEGKLVEAKLAEAGEQAGEADVAALVQWLEENQGDCAGAKLAALCKGRGSLKPGEGGIHRGRGDAPMTWQDPTSEQGAKYKAEALPPASLAALKDSKLMGVSVGDPTRQEAWGPAQAGALGGAATGGGSAHTHVILPKHRGSVERYFDREEDGPLGTQATQRR